MRKNILTVFVERIIILIFMCTTFIIVLSLVMGGLPNKNNGLSQFIIDSKNIIFKNHSADKIKVYMTKKDKVETIPLEEYVTGVVAGEMPAEFSEEALKAQAVAARTFAVAHMEKYGGTKYRSSTGADVCDSIQCQVFLSKEDRMNSWPEKKRDSYWNKITKAVSDTNGEVITYNGKLVMEPYYFAVSSGRTESALQVFNRDVGYLKSVVSTGDERASKYKTQKIISLQGFVNDINAKYPLSGLTVSNLNNQLYIRSRNDGGSVREIKLGGVTLNGTTFRSLMGLNSSNFTIKFSGNNVVINCLGYGHDVGMSQWGADAMGKSGYNYRDILLHYYSGVKINKISDIAN